MDFRFNCIKVLMLIGLFFNSDVMALSKSKVSFKDQLSYNKEKLVLNGVGVREATIFSVDVYVAALYLVEKSQSAEEILESETPKVFKMRFVRSVDAKKINKAWEKALQKDGLRKKLKTLMSATKDVKKGGELTFTFNSKKTTYYFNKKKVASFEGRAFAKALLSVWLGSSPPNPGLKSGLLGR